MNENEGSAPQFAEANDQPRRLDDFPKAMMRHLAMGSFDKLVRDNSGRVPTIFCDEHLRLSELLQRAGRSDGCANVFVLLDTGQAALFSLLPSESAIDEGSATEYDEPISQDLEVGMLLRYSETQPGGIKFSVRLPTSSAKVESRGPILAGA
ncbi:hypothetical protein [Gulosibacter molinativorax]|uniref:Uncharacterized protein n=1 Tax=Gulosibacter molinativorax TaxID=256821 RepID=A0ABT7C7M0_9MICO|nr:hypothetical protein [Gulosibacter molinativorax]MDJ1371152.1 hypothetical protein [Gulosibacter molinativorax]QUY62968.1 Hypotetical protein [Gulosibacter molinativorax]